MRKLLYVVLILVLLFLACGDPSPEQQAAYAAEAEKPAITILNDSDFNIVISYSTVPGAIDNVDAIIKPGDEYEIESGVNLFTIHDAY
jgi:hypothetical protein